MEKTENILPHRMTLDHDIEADWSLYTEVLDESDHGLDAEVERQLLAGDLVGLARILSGGLAEGEHGQEMAQTVLYRSLVLGYQLAIYSGIDDLPPPVELASYLSAEDGRRIHLDTLGEEINDYLNQRMHVDHLIKHATPAIDPNGQYGHLVEIYSGLVLMLSERRLADDYIASSLEGDDLTDWLNQL